MQIRFNGFSIWGGHFKRGLIKTSFQHLILFCKSTTLHNHDVGTFWNTRVPETKEEDGEKKLSQCSPRIAKRRRFSSFPRNRINFVAQFDVEADEIDCTALHYQNMKRWKTSSKMSVSSDAIGKIPFCAKLRKTSQIGFENQSNGRQN